MNFQSIRVVDGNRLFLVFALAENGYDFVIGQIAIWTSAFDNRFYGNELGTPIVLQTLRQPHLELMSGENEDVEGPSKMPML